MKITIITDNILGAGYSYLGQIVSALRTLQVKTSVIELFSITNEKGEGFLTNTIRLMCSFYNPDFVWLDETVPVEIAREVKKSIIWIHKEDDFDKYNSCVENKIITTFEDKRGKKYPYGYHPSFVLDSRRSFDKFSICDGVNKTNAAQVVLYTKPIADEVPRILAGGNFLLVDEKTGKAIEPFYKKDDDFVVCKNVKEDVEYWMNRREERKRISDNGFFKTRKNYDLITIIKDILCVL